MADTYFAGMKGTGDFITNENPENWRQGILRMFPNGMAPLTALTALMPSKKLTNGPVFHWWTKTLNAQSVAVTNIYVDTAMGTAYTTGGVAGQTLYVKMAEAASLMFRAGHQVLLRDASDLSVDVNARVTAVTQNGASSYIAAKLLEADDNGDAAHGSHTLATADTCLIIGDVNPQGGQRPEAITHHPTEYTNACQIMREAIDLTRTAEQTVNLRTEDPYKEAKRDALEQFSIQMEKNFWWSIYTSGTGTNGKPEYTQRGLISFIKTYQSANFIDYEYDTNSPYAGSTWLQEGMKWLNTQMELYFRWADAPSVVGYCGSGALLGLQELAMDQGVFQFSESTKAFGIQVTNWVTPFGTLMLKTHPLFSQNAVDRNTIVLTMPKNLTLHHVQDVVYEKSAPSGLDARQEGWLAELGLELDFPETFMYLGGVGKDNLYSS